MQEKGVLPGTSNSNTNSNNSSNIHNKKVEWVRADTEKLVYLNRILDAFYKVLESNIKILLSDNKTSQHMRLPIHLIRQSFVDKNLIFVKAPDNSLFEVSNPENCHFETNCYEPLIDLATNNTDYYKSLYEIYDLTKPSHKFKIDNKSEPTLLPNTLSIIETENDYSIANEEFLTDSNRNQNNQDEEKLIQSNLNDSPLLEANKHGKRYFDKSFELIDQVADTHYPAKRVLQFKEKTPSDLNDNVEFHDNHNLTKSLIEETKNLSLLEDDSLKEFNLALDQIKNIGNSINAFSDNSQSKLVRKSSSNDNSKINCPVFKTTSFNKINIGDNFKITKTESFNHSTVFNLDCDKNVDIKDQTSSSGPHDDNQNDNNFSIELLSDLTNQNNPETNLNDSKISMTNENALLETTFFTTNSSNSFLFNDNSCERITTVDTYRQSNQKFYTPDTGKIKMNSASRYFTPNFKQCYLDEMKDCDASKVSKLNFNAEPSKNQPLAVTTFESLSKTNDNNFYFEKALVAEKNINDETYDDIVEKNYNLDGKQLLKMNKDDRQLTTNNKTSNDPDSLDLNKNPTIFYYNANDNCNSIMNLNKNKNIYQNSENEFDDDDYDDEDNYDDYNNFDNTRLFFPTSKIRHLNQKMSVKEETTPVNEYYIDSNNKNIKLDHDSYIKNNADNNFFPAHTKIMPFCGDEEKIDPNSKGSELTPRLKLLYNHSSRKLNIANRNNDYFDNLKHIKVLPNSQIEVNLNRNNEITDEKVDLIESQANRKSEKYYLNINSQGGKEIKVLLLHDKDCKISVNKNRFYFKYKAKRNRQASSTNHELLEKSKTLDEYISAVAAIIELNKNDTSLKYTIVDSINAKNMKKDTRPRLLVNVKAAIDSYFELTTQHEKSLK